MAVQTCEPLVGDDLGVVILFTKGAVAVMDDSVQFGADIHAGDELEHQQDGQHQQDFSGKREVFHGKTSILGG